MDRTIPVIRDRYVDLEFGTGALKITPAHDPNDFDIGRRHGLESVKVIGDDGRMTAEAGRFAGLTRSRCRKEVVEGLKRLGLLEHVAPHKHNVGHCYRCKNVIEPNLSEQWFVKTQPLAEKAIAAVENADTRIVPDMWVKTYNDWMTNIRDWCISRQIWWGHQIPAWTCQHCRHIIVAMEAPERCERCGSADLVQETDVLDTWFSSALWPFSTMGWPEATPLLDRFYPTSVLVTGFDILFFWVARMMMMGVHFMKDVPFKDVYVHALVRDEDGKKMSKSKGNVIDPLSVIDRYGTDAFRFTLAAFAAQGRDIKMSEKRVEGYRHFVNKIWNAARFSLMHLQQGYPGGEASASSLADRWILSRLDQVTRSIAEALDTYRFNDAAGELYQFVWHEFCDWYLEAVKPTLYGKKGDEPAEQTRAVLWNVLKRVLILLHPFMPFVTEEIWHKLPGTQGSIMTAAFPRPADAPSAAESAHDAQAQMAALIAIITGIRNIRGEMNISPSMQLDASVHATDAALQQVLERHRDLIVNLARLRSFSVTLSGEKPKGAATTVIDGASIFVAMEGIVDIDQERQRLKKEINKIRVELQTVSKKLNNEDFLSKAPAAVVEKARSRHQALDEKQQKLQANLEKIETFAGE
jgi:valyl-tRNA synthetase